MAVVVASFSAGWAEAACTISCGPATNCVCSAPPGTTSCEFTTQWNAAAGAVLDCTGKDVTLSSSNGSFNVTNGWLTVLADDLVINTGAHVEATGSVAGTSFGMRIVLTGKLDLIGFLRANGSQGGGNIVVKAAGDVSMPPAGAVANGNGLIAEPTSPGHPGGHVDIDTEGVLVTRNPISVNGSLSGVGPGGSVNVRARDVTIGANVTADGSHGSGGSIQIVADALGAPSGGMVQVDERVSAEGAGTEGDGGVIEISGSQGVVLADVVSAQGGVGYFGGQASGGRVIIYGGPSGVAINYTVNATSGARGSEGGNVASIVAESAGSISVAAGVELLTKSDANGGDGGPIVLTAGGDVTIGDAMLDARGHFAGANSGAGGRIMLSGCDVTVAPGATLDVRGHDGGSVAVSARSRLDVSSPAGGPTTVVDAGGNGGEDGTVDLAYRAPWLCAAKNPTTQLRSDCLPNDVCRGVCSNDQARTCAVDPDCTVGCSTGQCQSKHCGNPEVPVCTTDADCNVCGAQGPCGANPLTANTDFNPDQPTVEQDASLRTCGELAGE